MEKMRAEYKRRRDYIVREINSIPNLSCREPEGAFYIFINVKALDISENEFTDILLEKYHVATVPGTVFGECGKGYLRLSFASSMYELIEGVARIRSAVASL